MPMQGSQTSNTVQEKDKLQHPLHTDSSNVKQ
jgi:hypothetical protein